MPKHFELCTALGALGSSEFCDHSTNPWFFTTVTCCCWHSWQWPRNVVCRLWNYIFMHIYIAGYPSACIGWSSHIATGCWHNSKQFSVKLGPFITPVFPYMHMCMPTYVKSLIFFFSAYCYGGDLQHEAIFMQPVLKTTAFLRLASVLFIEWR